MSIQKSLYEKKKKNSSILFLKKTTKEKQPTFKGIRSEGHAICFVVSQFLFLFKKNIYSSLTVYLVKVYKTKKIKILYHQYPLQKTISSLVYKFLTTKPSIIGEQGDDEENSSHKMRFVNKLFYEL